MKANRIILFTLLTAVVFALGSCNKKYTFPNSTVVPGADGQVKVKKQKGGVYTFDVNVENLANPSRLTPQREFYILWAESKNGEYQNLGTLDVSKRNRAKLSGAVTYGPQHFLVTAEDVKNANWPNLDQTIFKSERLKLK
ncbi:hypothetical protein ACFOUP_02165 [Belliella kenyensis]|uniref:DUF4352 domain-containing protein n=1 Tax=Belliella kenyensis TaxID=1472724 RepID=A0ABV8EJE6_9BACT|nr:hypothetical protein [Belliella kenyensis]MCH7400999.1 hypothetical protein [Belliella kenyensis]MDN3603997.1 hypothetical protein [Belliella kenyensis]